MSAGPTFEDYLISKKIDSARFKEAEPEMWHAWKIEFDQMHPNSFTVQKLNLINPVRRKYQLAIVVEVKKIQPAPPSPMAPSSKPGKPIMKPKTGLT
jgi:hypothetical protein